MNPRYTATCKVHCVFLEAVEPRRKLDQPEYAWQPAKGARKRIVAMIKFLCVLGGETEEVEKGFIQHI